MGNVQKYLAEALGTFTLVVVGSFAILSSLLFPAVGAGIVSIALGFGLALLIGLYAFAAVSGGHYNPAVSLAMFLDGRMSAADMVRYWIAQVAGAIAASIVVLIAYDDNAVANTTTQASDVWAAIVVEVVFTAVFIAVILDSTRAERAHGTALLAIPLTLVAIHFATASLTGASVNPARSIGSALLGGDLTGLWIYIVAPIIGAVGAWALFRLLDEDAVEEVAA